MATPIHPFNSHLESPMLKESTNFIAPGSDLLRRGFYSSSVYLFLCLVLGSLCWWKCAFFINCKYACTQRYTLSVRVACIL